MKLMKISYKTPEGDFMDVLAVSEVDCSSWMIDCVYMVKTAKKTLLNNEAREYLRNLKQ